MARTQLTSTNIGQVQRNDLDTTTSGEAVVTKVIKSGLIESSSTGVDAGTGDVTLSTKLDNIMFPGAGNLVVEVPVIEITTDKATIQDDGSQLTIGHQDAVQLNTPSFTTYGLEYFFVETPTGYIEDDGGSLILGHIHEVSLSTTGKVTAPNLSALNIGHSTSHASAIANIQSTSKGILIPKMTESQRTAISSPATGLLVYQTDGSEGLYQKLSTGWERIGSTGGGGSSLIVGNGDVDVDPTSKISVSGIMVEDLGSGEVGLSVNHKANTNAAVITISTTTYTLNEYDNGYVFYCTHASGCTITTATGFPVGFNCLIIQATSGQVTVAQGSGTTLNARAGFDKQTAVQWSAATLMVTATNTFLMTGDLDPS